MQLDPVGGDAALTVEVVEEAHASKSDERPGLASRHVQVIHQRLPDLGGAETGVLVGGCGTPGHPIADDA